MPNRQFAGGIHSLLSKLSANFIISLESFSFSPASQKAFSSFSFLSQTNEMENKFCGFSRVNLKSGKDPNGTI